MNVMDRFPTLIAAVGSFPEHEQDEVIWVLSNPKRSAEALASKLRAAGRKVSASTIRTYRRELAREQGNV